MPRRACTRRSPGAETGWRPGERYRDRRDVRDLEDAPDRDLAALEREVDRDPPERPRAVDPFLRGIFTPARRALDRPIAIACFRLFTGCFPRFACSISSRTNSPACVVAAFPSARSRRARRSVVFSGMPRT
ncbi:hypothetical protein AMOR_30870 [Anaeromyxobacter oryzae]|uniref:Uncharacterized protein n=1 Tax=Anaeromyxobacter oryzae TaxID=2918170 RepID=A0ABM7WX72_9BACT|nr:hypothetical protein AMOR_30870 [Anaeromyxobacter oryzae]